MTQSEGGVQCMMMRGGSSKGAYFRADDLPAEHSERDDLVRRIMGTPDARQIDGIGGAHPLTSKVAIVSRSARPDADVDYLFLQIGVEDAMVSDRQNCGNLLAGVAPFAIERGLVSVDSAASTTTLRIHMENTGSVATATVHVYDGMPVYSGTTAISGVPGAAAPIRLEFADIAGGTAGSLLPTGSARDRVSGVDCTLIDNGMPVVVLRADAAGITGYESCADLEANPSLLSFLEALHLEAGQLMGLGDVSAATVPKICLVAPPRAGGALSTRTFIPRRCHDAIGVLGAVSVATAALLPGSPSSEVMAPISGDSVILEHPTGLFEATIEISRCGGQVVVERAGIVRTARKLMDGVVYPRSD